MTSRKMGQMIMYVSAELKRIFEKGRDYPWKKPDNCPCCGSNRLWGHGFTTAIFDAFSKVLFLRRYRCPDCRCVIRMKPQGYFERFQASIKTIRSCLSERIKTGRWPDSTSPRKRHWMAALKRKALAYFGVQTDLFEAFDALQEKGIIPVSRGI